MATSHTQQVDEGWTQVRETVRMMNLAAAQIEISMKQSESSVDALANSFITMAARIQVIESLAQKENNESQQILQQCEAISTEIKQSITAFQFYDVFTQRLEHASSSLALLANIVQDEKRVASPVEWTLLQEKVKSNYSMSSEHQVFDLIMRGITIEEAVQNRQQGEDVELF